MSPLLGYVPFLTPLNAIQPVWYLLAIPFVFLISMIWKALRVRDMADYWRHVAVMSTLIVVGLAALAIALTLLVEVGIPALPLQRP
jgi:hypothetical protein